MYTTRNERNQDEAAKWTTYMHNNDQKATRTMASASADNHNDGKTTTQLTTSASPTPASQGLPSLFFSWVPWQRNTGACRMEADNSKHNGAANKTGG